MPMTLFLKDFLKLNSTKFLVLIFLLFIYNESQAQKAKSHAPKEKSHAEQAQGRIKGSVVDGSSNKTLYSVNISIDDALASDSTLANGEFLIQTTPGKHIITFEREGFQSKKISEVKVGEYETAYLTVVLYPVAHNTNSISKDSITTADTTLSLNHIKEKKEISKRNPINLSNFDALSSEVIRTGTDKNAALLLKRLTGLTLLDNPYQSPLQTLTIKGLGERYNQLSLNGVGFNSQDRLSRSFLIDVIPVEIIENVSVQKSGDVASLADYAGGSVNIKTKDFPENNFYFIQVGGGFNDKTRNKAFLGEKSSEFSFLSFPGKGKDMPEEFPTLKSRYPLYDKNIQEQVRLSKLLSNNLAPVNDGLTKPNDQFKLGFGRKFNMKNGEILGITAFLTQRKSQVIENITIQAVPKVATNPFPFTNNKLMLGSQSQDTRYRYNADLTGVLNTSIAFGRNVISIKNLFGSIYNNTFTQRSQYAKSDQDTVAQDAINYLTDNKKFLNTQVTGTHALGADGKFKMDWNASYIINNEKNPDERNFMLKRETLDANRYEIAGSSAFTNSSRQWRNFKNSGFSGNLNILVPVNFINHPQVISGGVGLINRNSSLSNDLYLYNGKGFETLENLLSPDRYYPGGLEAINFFNKNNKDITGLGNYTASSNIGASYLKLETKLSNTLFVDAGIRMESSSNLVSNFKYEYITGFKNPQQVTINSNTNVIDFSFLPSVTLKYSPIAIIQLNAAYFKTVNRPQLQELSFYGYYDASLFTMRTGNPILKNTDIQNYNIGMLASSGSGVSFSLSGFYKRIYEPIENVLSAYSVSSYQSTPFNAPPATVKGIDANIKTTLSFISQQSWLSKTTIFASTTLLKSKVEAGYLRSNVTNVTPEIEEHPLSGSPDLSVNAGITLQQIGIPEFTILYNHTSDYLSAVGSGKKILLANGNHVLSIPHYYTKGMDQLDVQISQKFYKSRIQLIVGANNLLNANYTVYQDLNGNKKLDEAIATKSNAFNRLGYYQSGTDNTVINIKAQRSFFTSLTYRF